MPVLDTRTLTIVVAAVTVVLLGAQVLSWRIHPRVYGTGHWALMTSTAALGFSLLAAGEVLPPSLGVVLPNLLLVGGTILGLQGMRRFRGRERSSVERVAEPLIFGFVALFQIYFTYVEPSYRARVVLVSSATAIGIAAMVVELLRGGTPHTRFMRYATAVPFAVTAVVLVLRVRHFALHDDVGAGFLDSTRWQSITLLVVISCVMAWTMGLLLLVAQHVQHELRLARDDLERLASTDALTAIANRRGFIEAAEAEVARALRYDKALSVIMFDVDHFKKVNDTYGHAAGDEVLAGAVARCREELRAQDVFGRLGGEEFAILLPETDAAGAAKLAERLRRALAATPITTEVSPIATTASFGVSSIACGEPTLTAMLALADEGVYRAKDQGRNAVVICDDAGDLAQSTRHVPPSSHQRRALG